MTDIEKVAAKFKGNFPLYAKNVLKIVNKEGQSTPFILNNAQLHLHNMLEKQLSQQGNVRALVLKARQTGISTYSQGRNFWKVTQNRNANAFVLSHLAESTNAIFNMVRYFYDNIPHPAFKPLCLLLVLLLSFSTSLIVATELGLRGLRRLVEDKQTVSSMGQKLPSTLKGRISPQVYYRQWAERDLK